MIYKCPTCGAENPLVNFCGCDPNNMPTRAKDGDMLTVDELFADVGSALDCCRKIGRPVIARVAGEWFKLFPPGMAQRM